MPSANTSADDDLSSNLNVTEPVAAVLMPNGELNDMRKGHGLSINRPFRPAAPIRQYKDDDE